MKPPVCKLLAALLASTLASIVGLRAADDTPPPLGVNPTPIMAGNTPPAAPISPTPDAGKPGKKAKPPRDPNAPPKLPKVKKPKPIPFPLPVGDSGKVLTIPEYSGTAQLLSQIMAMKATRISNELVQMQEMKMDLYHPDGKEDFHIILPTSVFNLETHIIHSEEPVTVQTQDFELTGDKMEFNTVDRTGQLLGHVHMVVHNLKQVVGPQQPPNP